jgi:hypothetical protein
MRNVVKKFTIALMAALALVMLGPSAVHAQEEERHEGIGVGIKGGWTFSKFNAEGVDFDRRTGQQIGIFLGGNRPGTIGVGAEINYGRRVSGDPDDEDTELGLRYVSVPVYARVNAGARTLEGINFYGLVGPQLDWILNQTITIDGEDFDLEEDLGEETEGFEFSLMAAAGIEITRFIAEVRYIHGLKSISKTFDVANAGELKSKAFAILFGFRFN